MKGLTKCSHHLIPSFFLLIFNILLFYLGHVSMTKWPINCLWTLDSKKKKKIAYGPHHVQYGKCYNRYKFYYITFIN